VFYTIKKEYKSQKISEALSRAENHFSKTGRIPSETEFLDYREGDELSIKQSILIAYG